MWDWLRNHDLTRARQLYQQPLHFAWAFVALVPIAYYGAHWWAYALSGLLIDIPREFVEQWPTPIKNTADCILDLSFFAIGGAAVGMILGG